MSARAWLRIVCIVATFAAVLVPALSSPARTIRVPRTLAASTTLDRDRGLVASPSSLTHVAFSWAGTERGRVGYRTIDDGGTRSPWRTATETHDLELNDRHYSGVLAVYGAKAVEFRRIHPRGGWMGPVTIDMLDALGGPRREVTVPSLAHGLATEPRVVTRAEWGADEKLQSSSGGCARTFFPVQQLFVHHTAGTNYDSHPRATMRSMLWYHTARRGWCDIGYNFVIGPDGSVFEGRRARVYLPWETHDSEDLTDQVVRGAHTMDHNPGAVGVSLMGNFTSVRPTRAARRALLKVLAWEADRHRLDPTSRHVYVNGETGARDRMKMISGHRDASSTSCPGGVLYRMLPSIRRAVERRIGEGKIRTRLTLDGASPIDHGSEPDVTALLTRRSGAVLAGRPLKIYARDLSAGGWTLLSEGVTGTDGAWPVQQSPEATTLYAAVYEGATRAWASHSTILNVAVRPVVTLMASGGALDGQGVTHFPPGTTSVTLEGTVTPAHPVRDVRITIDRLDDLGAVTYSSRTETPLSEDGGTYAYLLPTTAGRYRLRTALPRHHDHARGRSAYLYVTVDEPI